jgi:cyanate permease
VTALLWVGTVLLAAGITVGNVLLPSVIKRDFPTRIGPMTGVYSATAGVVASVASGIAVPLADVLPGGWRTALGIWAGLALTAAAVWAPRLSRPAQPAPETADEASDVASAGVSPWRSPLAWEVAAFMALASAGFYTVISWYPTVLHDFGTSEVTAGWLLFVYQIVGIVMSLTVPLLLRGVADQRMVAAAASLIVLIGYLGLVLYPDIAALWVIITGLGAGAVFTLALALFSLRAADERSAASLAGMGQAVAYLFAAVWPLLFGVAGDTTGGWTMPLWLLVALAAGQIAVAVRAGRDAQFRA